MDQGMAHVIIRSSRCVCSLCGGANYTPAVCYCPLPFFCGRVLWIELKVCPLEHENNYQYFSMFIIFDQSFCWRDDLTLHFISRATVMWSDVWHLNRPNSQYFTEMRLHILTDSQPLNGSWNLTPHCTTERLLSIWSSASESLQSLVTR